jgi:hypothetical protein
MLYYKLPELTPEEKKMPLAKFYENYPLYGPAPLHQAILDAGPMNPADAIPAQNWLDLLDPDGFPKTVYGYCIMPDGCGFYSEYYITPPTVTTEMRRWFGRWTNFRSKSMVEGQGNLRYKLWCPVDHWDHKFVNGVDDKNGVYALGTLDLGKSMSETFKGIGETNHVIDLREYGLTEEREAELKAAGCKWSAVWEDFEGPGHHLVLRYSRPCHFGGYENVNVEWIGYYAKDGKIIRDEETPVDEDFVKNILIHNTVEHQHINRILPELYTEYHDKPIDAD